jgi:hypothetical protein
LATNARAERAESAGERPTGVESTAAEGRTATSVAAPPAAGSPRAWPIVVGSVLLVPSYGLAAYYAFAGGPKSYGPVPPDSTRGELHLGSPGWLIVPVIGPLIFDKTSCNDAETYFAAHPSSDDLYAACHGWFWQLDAAVQAIGTAFFVAGFLFPNEPARKSGFSLRVVPLATHSSAGVATFGEF